MGQQHVHPRVSSLTRGLQVPHADHFDMTCSWKGHTVPLPDQDIIWCPEAEPLNPPIFPAGTSVSSTFIPESARLLVIFRSTLPTLWMRPIHG